jgi:glycosyltransferase involved in cell wall biosynthesis
MLVSVVVPAFNEAKLIPQTLAAIKSACAAFDELGWDWEIVVCDNNSTDRTAELVREAGATVVFEPINQISRARNRGASGARGDWIIFVDADSFPSAALFAATAKRISSGKCAGGGCLVRLDEKNFMLNLGVWLWTALSVLNRWAAGSYIFCRADLFREVGGFSTELFASEELDFSKRFKRLARARGLCFEIIREEKLVTSARKIHLYGRRTHIRFFFKVLLFHRQIVKNRERCILWYDGRR